ncbi:hypothetical protein Cadr_000015808 [Camelus dromedarius]|uniref:Uncharacterized protein n=1 Tax=Camelus dromedarius TaxID=9838 RepID=A0A5N4EBQ3_CAMDR|nr:hypothetical protein Cadr_000015808 [Camelus dromedarius]
MVEWGDGEYCGKSRFGWEHQEFSFEMSTGNERDVDKAGLYRNEELEDSVGNMTIETDDSTIQFNSTLLSGYYVPDLL